MATPPKPDLAERWGQSLSRNWPEWLNILGSLLLAGVSVPNLFAPESDFVSAHFSFALGSWGPLQWIFIFGASLVTVGVIFARKIRATKSQLLTQIVDSTALGAQRSAAVEGVLRSVLMHLSQSLALHRADTRASVYCFENEHFLLLSRVSDNAQWQKGARVAFPVGPGQISKAWKGGGSVRFNLPKDRAAWEGEMVNDGFMPELAKKFVMQSRSYVAVRVEAKVGADILFIGVMVLESERPSGALPLSVFAVRTDPYWKILEDAMTNARDQLPAIARAVALTQP